MLRCYTCDKCGTFEAFVKNGKKNRDFHPCPHCKEKAQRDLTAEHGGFRHKPGNWPLHSEALAVHPEQRIEAMKVAEKYKCPTDYDTLGRPVFLNAAHRVDFCRKVRPDVFCRNAGYSDPCPR